MARDEVAVPGRFVADDFIVLREAALRGMGIAQLQATFVREPIRRMELVPLLEGLAPPPVVLHLLYPGGHHLPVRTRAFIDFVRARLAQDLAEGAPLGSRFSLARVLTASATARQAERREDSSSRERR